MKFPPKKENTKKCVILSSENLVGKSNFSSKEDVRANFVLEPNQLPYCLVVSCFHPKEYGNFEVIISIKKKDCENPEAALQAYPCTGEWHFLQFNVNYFHHLFFLQFIPEIKQGKWDEKTAGGCRNNKSSWLNNRQFNFKVLEDCTTLVLLKLSEGTESIGFYILNDQRVLQHSSVLREEDVKYTNLVTKTKFVNTNEVFQLAKFPAGTYKIIPATYAPGILRTFSIFVFCDSKFSLVRAESVDNLRSRFKKMKTEIWEIDEYSLDMSAATVVGKGGYGVVYRAIYQGREVAVKKVQAEKIKRSEVSLYKKECEILSKHCGHPNLVRFVGAQVSEDKIFIVTEYCEFGSLSDVFKSNRPKMDWVKKLKWAIQTCSGMSFLHSQKPPIVHRDLKSLNL